MMFAVPQDHEACSFPLHEEAPEQMEVRSNHIRHEPIHRVDVRAWRRFLRHQDQTLEMIDTSSEEYALSHR